MNVYKHAIQFTPSVNLLAAYPQHSLKFTRFQSDENKSFQLVIIYLVLFYLSIIFIFSCFSRLFFQFANIHIFSLMAKDNLLWEFGNSGIRECGNVGMR